MSVFIVVTEECYGGDEKIKVFREKDAAEKYAGKLPDYLDHLIVERSIKEDEKKVYLKVTEEYYGGEDKIRVFDTKEKAEKCQCGNLDTIVLEKHIK